MGKYIIDYSTDAKEDIKKFEKAGNKIILNKINNLINELKEHPRTGTGHPEQLKGYDGKRWSRRITGKHRLIYDIEEEIVTVLVISAFGHYDDD